jgi:hypothetical protein
LDHASAALNLSIKAILQPTAMSLSFAIFPGSFWMDHML